MQILTKQVKSGLPRAKVSYDPQKNIWILEEEYRYKDEIKESEIIVGKNFKFDLSSIPRLFWIIIGKHELSLEAPLIHDFMYKSRGGELKCDRNQKILGNIEPEGICYSREQADNLFERMMKDAGVKWFRIFLGYAAVRIFGIFYWPPNILIMFCEFLSTAYLNSILFLRKSPK